MARGWQGHRAAYGNDFVGIKSQNIIAAEIFAQLEKELSGDIGRAMGVYGRTVNRNLTRAKGLKEINEKTIQGSKRAVLNAYDNSVGKSRKPYRQADPGKWRRFAGGRLRRSLEKAAHYQADQRGMKFINKKVLDKDAKQWYRLNFGAKPGKAIKRSDKPMTFFSAPTNVRFNLSMYSQSPRFRVPPGYWASKRVAQTQGAELRQRGDALYPVTKGGKGPGIVAYASMPLNQARWTKGIDARGFLDRGAWYINRWYPERFERLAKSWFYTS